MSGRFLILPLAIGTLLSHNYAYSSEKEDIKSLFSIKRDVEVVSVSKTPERAFEAPSAIHVITQDDIRRIGATSIPEALRIVPGLEVTRTGSSKWAITSRGFNREFVNKMLVLIDGRSVYTPLFSGIYWDTQDTAIEDIDRIEVIRGPGATLWGANAVNGVINIITKDSRLTHGSLVSILYGNEERANITARYGGKTDGDINYRVYTKYFKRAELETSEDYGGNDEWEMMRMGFRTDWEKTARNQFSITGDIYGGYNESPLILPSITNVLAGDDEVRGGNIVAKWKRVNSNDSIYDLQVYFDYVKRDIAYLEQERKTFDVDFQHLWKKIPKNEITWGLGYRIFWDNLISPKIENNAYVDYTPDVSYNNLYSGFIQDKITLVDKKLFLTVGSKFEHNFYTEYEIQPNARIAWLPDDNQTVWAAVSRAVRIPSRGEEGLVLHAAGTAPNFINQVGNGLDSEELTAYEVGYRVKPRYDVSFDMTAFHNDYENLRSFELSGLDFIVANQSYAESYGFEITGEWYVTENWSLVSSYNFITMNMHVDTDSVDTITEPGNEKASPNNQIKLRSHLNLPHNLEFDNILYFVDNLSSKNVDNYVRFDTRISWNPSENFELSLVGQNLLDDSHPEFAQALYSAQAEIGRSVYGKVTWRF